ncbi:hypothetical protein CYLTODRAFT_157592 [Cylindrobasidium torrendii FP15055 ss-10]|uniref:Uncharacterized protein n=1 Tax=Cylindrobasidium torrendii FP15055 ss-10 TaxID=1314674 RepID=A0A0D7BKC6_9AGAR|nr:hypothetical protein CYLTODRAFT_157592 [Cylindrobasidium torrendii FP15055 ss-10]
MHIRHVHLESIQLLSTSHILMLYGGVAVFIVGRRCLLHDPVQCKTQALYLHFLNMTNSNNQRNATSFDAPAYGNVQNQGVELTASYSGVENWLSSPRRAHKVRVVTVPL